MISGCFLEGIEKIQWHEMDQPNITKKKQTPEVLFKKGALKIFTKFTGKHLCQSLFFNKVAGLRPATLLKMRLWQRCFLRILLHF